MTHCNVFASKASIDKFQYNNPAAVEEAFVYMIKQ